MALRLVQRWELHSNVTKCVFLGYVQGTKGYWLNDTNHLKVFYSWDVKFCENDQVFEPDSNSETDYHFVVHFSNCEVPGPANYSQSAAELVARRLEWERRSSDFYGERANTCAQNKKEPTTLQEALSSPKSSCWMNAEKWIHWNLLELPKGRKPVGTK